MIKSISRHQAISVFLMVMFAIKFNRMLGLFAQFLQRDAWILFVSFLLVDFLMLLVVLKIADLTRNVSFLEALQMKTGKVFSRILIFFMSLFFFLMVLLPFRGVHDIFSNVVFDGLAWEWFSVPLLLLIVYFVSKGMPTISRTSEIFIAFVVVGFLGTFLLALPTAFFSKILPVNFPSIVKLLEGHKRFALWFSDYFLIFLFIGKAEKKHFKKTMIITQLSFYVILVLTYVVFYSIMENMATFQRVSLVSMTEAALLGFDLGRSYWILQIFVSISSVIGVITYTYAASEAMSFVTKVNRKYLGIAFAVLIYICDVKIFKNINTVRIAFFDYFSWFGVVMAYFVPFLILFLFLINRKSYNKKAELYFKNNILKLKKTRLGLSLKNKKAKQNTFVQNSTKGGLSSD